MEAGHGVGIAVGTPQTRQGSTHSGVLKGAPLSASTPPEYLPTLALLRLAAFPYTLSHHVPKSMAGRQ